MFQGEDDFDLDDDDFLQAACAVESALSGPQAGSKRQSFELGLAQPDNAKRPRTVDQSPVPTGHSSRTQYVSSTGADPAPIAGQGKSSSLQSASVTGTALPAQSLSSEAPRTHGKFNFQPKASVCAAASITASSVEPPVSGLLCGNLPKTGNAGNSLHAKGSICNAGGKYAVPVLGKNESGNKGNTPTVNFGFSQESLESDLELSFEIPEMPNVLGNTTGLSEGQTTSSKPALREISQGNERRDFRNGGQKESIGVAVNQMRNSTVMTPSGNNHSLRESSVQRKGTDLPTAPQTTGRPSSTVFMTPASTTRGSTAQLRQANTSMLVTPTMTSTTSGSTAQLRQANTSMLVTPTSTTRGSTTQLRQGNSSTLVTPASTTRGSEDPSAAMFATPVAATRGLRTPASRGGGMGDTPRPVRTKTKRKFPGPAGALPRLGAQENLDVAAAAVASPQSLVDTSPKTVDKDLVPCTQSSQSQSQEAFFDGPWKEMEAELQPITDQILANNNIDLILKKACRKQLWRGKVPALCVIIDSIDFQGADASVVFKDLTGTMKGTIHRQVLRELQAELQVGSVLVLRQVSVFSPSSRNHYLNVTPNNMVYLYGRNIGGDVKVLKFGDLTQEDLNPPPQPPPAPRTPGGDPQNRGPTAGLMAPSTPGINQGMGASPRGMLFNQTPRTPQMPHPVARGNPSNSSRFMTPPRGNYLNQSVNPGSRQNFTSGGSGVLQHNNIGTPRNAVPLRSPVPGSQTFSSNRPRLPYNDSISAKNIQGAALNRASVLPMHSSSLKGTPVPSTVAPPTTGHVQRNLAASNSGAQLSPRMPSGGSSMASTVGVSRTVAPPTTPHVIRNPLATNPSQAHLSGSFSSRGNMPTVSSTVVPSTVGHVSRNTSATNFSGKRISGSVSTAGSNMGTSTTSTACPLRNPTATVGGTNTGASITSPQPARPLSTVQSNSSTPHGRKFSFKKKSPTVEGASVVGGPREPAPQEQFETRHAGLSTSVVHHTNKTALPVDELWQDENLDELLNCLEDDM